MGRVYRLPTLVEKVDLKERISTRLFSFDPKEHEDALALPLGLYLKERLQGKVERFKTTGNIVENLAGLYWLNHTINGPLTDPRTPFRMKDRATTLYEAKLAATSELVANYLIAICSGELRHGQNGVNWQKCKKCEPYYSKYKRTGTRSGSRTEGSTLLWEVVKKSDNPTYGEILDRLVHGFTAHHWSTSGLGGPRWGYIAYMARDLFVAWAEGDINGMSRTLDFIVHAVHNGCNCLHNKFDWYITGPMHLFEQILTAKFIGEPCCWGRIRSCIPMDYRVVDPPATPNVAVAGVCEGKHKLTRSSDTINQEETLFCEFFRAETACKTCGKGEEGACQNWCMNCKKCFPGFHVHMCQCTRMRPDPSEPKCPEFCQICFDLYLKAYQTQLPAVWDENKTDPGFAYLNDYPGCGPRLDTKRRAIQHTFCHACGDLQYNGIGLGSKHKYCPKSHAKGLCPKTGQCELCEIFKTFPEMIAITKLVENTKFDPPATPPMVTVPKAGKAMPDLDELLKPSTLFNGSYQYLGVDNSNTLIGTTNLVVVDEVGPSPDLPTIQPLPIGCNCSACTSGMMPAPPYGDDLEIEEEECNDDE